MGPNIIVDIGKTEAIMPSTEQIPNERYHLNQRLTVYVLEIREGSKGEEIIVSRSNSGLLQGLFFLKMGSIVFFKVPKTTETSTPLSLAT